MRIKTLLIANRGEIACRIIRTARAMGIKTVAVYSDADRDAPHVRAADTAFHIGPSEAALSYLDAARIIDVARKAGADAVHPGYGFLSENAEFAADCVAAGLRFVGPSADVIRLMGSKIEAKTQAIAAGVPVVPGYNGADQSDETLCAQAGNRLSLAHQSQCRWRRARYARGGRRQCPVRRSGHRTGRGTGRVW